MCLAYLQNYDLFVGMGLKHAAHAVVAVDNKAGADSVHELDQRFDGNPEAPCTTE